jgi:hypothetical protein
MGKASVKRSLAKGWPAGMRRASGMVLYPELAPFPCSSVRCSGANRAETPGQSSPVTLPLHGLDP